MGSSARQLMRGACHLILNWSCPSRTVRDLEPRSTSQIIRRNRQGEFNFVGLPTSADFSGVGGPTRTGPTFSIQVGALIAPGRQRPGRGSRFPRISHQSRDAEPSIKWFSPQTAHQRGRSRPVHSWFRCFPVAGARQPPRRPPGRAPGCPRPGPPMFGPTSMGPQTGVPEGPPLQVAAISRTPDSARRSALGDVMGRRYS